MYHKKLCNFLIFSFLCNKLNSFQSEQLIHFNSLKRNVKIKPWLKQAWSSYTNEESSRVLCIFNCKIAIRCSASSGHRTPQANSGRRGATGSPRKTEGKEKLTYKQGTCTETACSRTSQCWAAENSCRRWSCWQISRRTNRWVRWSPTWQPPRLVQAQQARPRRPGPRLRNPRPWSGRSVWFPGNPCLHSPFYLSQDDENFDSAGSPSSMAFCTSVRPASLFGVTLRSTVPWIRIWIHHESFCFSVSLLLLLRFHRIADLTRDWIHEPRSLDRLRICFVGAEKRGWEIVFAVPRITDASICRDSVNAVADKQASSILIFIFSRTFGRSTRKHIGLFNTVAGGISLRTCKTRTVMWNLVVLVDLVSRNR